MAGTIRAQYPSSIRPVRVLCTARVSPDMIMRALNQGADGVIVGGWHAGECDFVKGNLHSQKLVQYIQDVLETLGLERERIRMIFVSAAEGTRFQQLATEMHNTIMKLGPSKLHLHHREVLAKAAAKKAKKASQPPVSGK